ncbi:alkylmercury lyase family protein [Elioraea sp.]|uniref:alkylmercury lyase family protein n=1 Tax=Elioraea sp. TaxID=2185103 RepID=UPI003F70EA02
MALPLSADFAPGETVALRPDLALPDWTLLTDPSAREALAAAMAVAGRRDRWAGLDVAEDAVRRTVLLGFAAFGVPPSVTEIAASIGLDAEAVHAALARLAGRDILVLDADGAIAAAYPFSAEPTPHRVTLARFGTTVYALCAIDALGIGAMLGADTLIESRCAASGAPVTLRTQDHGRTLAELAPADAVIWYGIAHAGGCAARSGCALKLFFRSEADLVAWRARNDEHPGYRLSVPIALQLALALFAPMIGGGQRADTATTVSL